MSFGNQHQRALDLVHAQLAGELRQEDAPFLQSHLATCAACGDEAFALQQVARDIAGIHVSADTSLVRTTQMAVRSRARELNQHDQNFNPLWVALFFACGWALLSAPLLWQGMQWISHTSDLPLILWQVLFGIAWLTPTAGVAAIAAHKHDRSKLLA